MEGQGRRPCAAKFGGRAANDRWPAQFLYDNLAIAANFILAAEAAVPHLTPNTSTSCATECYGDSAGFSVPSDQVASNLPVASDLTSM